MNNQVIRTLNNGIVFRNGILVFCCLISLLFILSCEADLKYDLNMNDFKPQLAINCTFTNDSLWRVYVSKSSGILANESWDIVNNAVVTISDSNEIISVLDPNGIGQYTSQHKPQFNQRYNLKITVPGFETIEASDFQPEQIQIDGIYFTDSISLEENEYLSQVSISISDNGSLTNFYQIIVYQKDNNNQIVSLMLKSDDLAIENSANYNITGGNSKFKEYLVANDQLFNGTIYSFNLKFFKIIPDADVFVEIRSLSANLHEYVLSYSKFTENIDDLFAEPLNVYSNINNGLGIFGGYSSYSHKITVINSSN
ncbi:MAG: DUF4249 domain-containing protein [Bacteroidales bacterium]|nr:DUF4249 domain-containing protein [Bacteroidales bacterium]MBN2818861.1 DUF4249 domain-containing protein [Bacteroidales bacterium]